MKLEIDITSQPMAILEHEGTSLMFDLSAFNKRALPANDITTHINEYWASLSSFQQQKIFEIYNQIREAFENVNGTTAMLQVLLPMVQKLYDQHEQKRIREWILMRVDLAIPARILDTFERTDEKPFTHDRTYTKPDYIELLILTLSLRVMLPVWGEFIWRTREETGTNFKEYYAFSLLAKTNLMDTPAMQKLERYIKGNAQDDKPMTNIIAKGISREDYPKWQLAKVLVRRLCIGDMRGIEQNTNLVVTIFNDLNTQNNPSGNSSFGEIIQPKKFEGEDSNEQGISRLENYKIKAEHSAGEIASIARYMHDPFRVAYQLDPTLNPGLLMQFLECTKALEDTQLWTCQISVVQWVMAAVLPPRGISYLDKIVTLRAFAVTQTYLWQHGHKQLAGLVGAAASDNAMTFHQTGLSSMARVANDQKAAIEKLVPNQYISPKRRNTQPMNKGLEAISLVAQGFNARDWLLTLPDAMALELTGNQHQRRYACPHEINQMLAKLAITCASRPKARAVPVEGAVS